MQSRGGKGNGWRIKTVSNLSFPCLALNLLDNTAIIDVVDASRKAAMDSATRENLSG